MADTFEAIVRHDIRKKDKDEENASELIQESVQKYVDDSRKNRIEIGKMLLQNLPFVSSNGQPLPLIPLLKLNPELLEQPLYH